MPIGPCTIGQLEEIFKNYPKDTLIILDEQPYLNNPKKLVSNVAFCECRHEQVVGDRSKIFISVPAGKVRYFSVNEDINLINRKCLVLTGFTDKDTIVPDDAKDQL